MVCWEKVKAIPAFIGGGCSIVTYRDEPFRASQGAKVVFWESRLSIVPKRPSSWLKIVIPWRDTLSLFTQRNINVKATSQKAEELGSLSLSHSLFCTSLFSLAGRQANGTRLVPADVDCHCSSELRWPPPVEEGRENLAGEELLRGH